MSEFLYFLVFILALILPLIWMETQEKKAEDDRLLVFEKKQLEFIEARIAYGRVHLARLKYFEKELARVCARDDNRELQRVHDELKYQCKLAADSLTGWSAQKERLLHDAHHNLEEVTNANI